MSRVRILNLPRECTEEQLRRHLLTSLPPSAPHLEITDCVIKRAPPAPGKKTGIIRMAFVGFRNSSSGHFVVRHFDGTYLRSAKLRVEIAKGLGEVDITTNMRKKMEAVKQKQNAEAQPQTASITKKGGNGKRAREEEGEGSKKVTNSPKGEKNDSNAGDAGDMESRLKRERKELFISERTKATSGPSWAAEVLVPDSAQGVNGTDAEDEHTISSRRKRENLDEGEETRGVGVGGTDNEEVNEEERMRQALERQKTLGTVSDMDFLASLGNHNESNNTRPSPDETKRHGTEGTDGGDDDEGVVGYKGKQMGNANEDGKEKAKDVQSSGGDGVEQQRHAPSTLHVSSEEVAIVQESRRIRLGNIPFIATEDDVKQFASSLVGPVEAIHIPLTRDTKQSKGGAFIKFERTEDALEALTKCRGAIFMGRLLRVSAAEEDPYTKKLEEAQTTGGDGNGGLAGSSDFKRRKEQDRKKDNNGGVVWNTMYMNSHAAVEVVAKRLGVQTDDVVSANARGAAVRAAIAEAYLTTEVQQVLSDEGIDFGLLESAQQNILKSRSNTTILVKNIQTSAPEDVSELTRMFLRYGVLEVTAVPSAGTFALFRYAHQQDARIAFRRLSYKLFKSNPLFLEWAPIGVILDDTDAKDESHVEGETGNKGLTEGENKDLNNNRNNGNTNEDGNEDLDDDAKRRKAAFSPVLTLFITNIPFTATEEQFHEFLLDACARLAKNSDAHIERLAFDQEKGRAFLTLREQSIFAYVQHRLNGRSFAGRTLACVPSKQTTVALEHLKRTPMKNATNTTDAEARNAKGTVAGDDEDEEDVVKSAAVIARRGGAAQRSHANVPAGCDPLKLVVKNVPFEATERDIRELFSAFSEVRSVRLPRKSHQFSSHRENNHRGFAFVEFLSEEEARRAMATLKATHLYGRHLVLQYAKLDDR